MFFGLIDGVLHSAVITLRGDTYRIMSLRHASRRERRLMAKRSTNDPDAPEQGADFFARAKRGARHLPADLVTAVRVFRGKQKAPTKQVVSLRLSRDVVAAYKKTGRGWQSRIDVDLKRAAKRLHSSE